MDLKPIKVGLCPCFSQGSPFIRDQEFHPGLLSRRISAHTTARDHAIGASCAAAGSWPLVGAHSAHYLCPVPDSERNPNRNRDTCGQQVGVPHGFWCPKRPSPAKDKAWSMAPMTEEGAWLWFISCAFLHSEDRTTPLLRSVHRIHPILFFIVLS